MKARKKPIEVEVIQFIEDNISECQKFCGNSIKCHPMAGCVIGTLEGDMALSKNDWIIKGVQGEFYPCKPGIFEKTYILIE